MDTGEQLDKALNAMDRKRRKFAEDDDKREYERWCMWRRSHGLHATLVKDGRVREDDE